MSFITLEGVGSQIAGRQLFSGVDLQINAGDRLGLIGVNGSGKSTLLAIVAGEEPPTEGRVTRWGDVRVSFLAQRSSVDPAQTVDEALLDAGAPDLAVLKRYRRAEAAAHTGDAVAQEVLSDLLPEMDRLDGWGAEARARAVLTRLGFDRFAAPIAHLSGGEAKRVELARVLLAPSDVLLLDEPTNHIDAEAIAWLEDELAGRPGAMLLVTHDRYFLERVVNRILELDRREVTAYPGSYSRYLELRAERHERLAQSERKREKLLRRELEWLRRAPKARGTKQKARAQRVHELETIKVDRGDEAVTIALAGRRLGKEVLTATGITVRYDGRAVLRAVDFALAPGARVGIVGPNGAGKSTLLDVLAGRITPEAGVVAWGSSVHLGTFDQHSRALDDDVRLIKYVESVAPVMTTPDGQRVTAARMLEWFLVPGEQQWTLLGSLSGGERRRIQLLAALVQQPNVLFLDEPTNDLDIPTLQVVEEFLDRFAGALVVVSHDRYFLDRTVDFLYTLSDGVLEGPYPAPFATFQRLRAEAGRGAHPNPEPEKVTKAGDTRRGTSGVETEDAAGSGLRWSERKELAELEARVPELETRRAALEAAIQDAGGAAAVLDSLADELATLGRDLDVALARWLELSERA